MSIVKAYNMVDFVSKRISLNVLGVVNFMGGNICS